MALKPYFCIGKENYRAHLQGGEATLVKLQGAPQNPSKNKGKPKENPVREGCKSTLPAPPPGLEPIKGSPSKCLAQLGILLKADKGL